MRNASAFVLQRNEGGLAVAGPLRTLDRVLELQRFAGCDAAPVRRGVLVDGGFGQEVAKPAPAHLVLSDAGDGLGDGIAALVDVVPVRLDPNDEDRLRRVVDEGAIALLALAQGARARDDRAAKRIGPAESAEKGCRRNRNQRASHSGWLPKPSP